MLPKLTRPTCYACGKPMRKLKPATTGGRLAPDHWNGYGYHTPGTPPGSVAPLFCRLGCALTFAVIALRGGARIMMAGERLDGGKR